ncbi:MAG TPA: OmpA family protein [Burkholderiaceae bacterium]
MKLSLLTLSGLTAILLLAGCATQSSTTSAPAAAPAAPAAATGSASTAPKAAQQAVAPAPKKVSITSTVYFDKANAALNKQAKAEIDGLLSKLKDIKLEVIVVVGHTDNKGSASANARLGMRRANAVKSYLMTKGIAANQVYTDSTIDASTSGRKAKDAHVNSRRAEIEAIGYSSK